MGEDKSKRTRKMKLLATFAVAASAMSNSAWNSLRSNWSNWNFDGEYGMSSARADLKADSLHEGQLLRPTFLQLLAMGQFQLGEHLLRLHATLQKLRSRLPTTYDFSNYPRKEGPRRRHYII